MKEAEWKEMCTREQLKLFNAACGDLSNQLSWHGFGLSRDDWRHMLSGTVMGWRMMPGVDRGEGVAPGLIMLGGSSLDLKKAQCSEAIELAFLIGDHPQGQGIDAAQVRWCAVVCGARWVADEGHTLPKV